MQSFTLTYSDGRPPEPLQVPTRWAEVSTQQYLHLMTGKDTGTPTLCVLTGLSAELLGKVVAADAVYLANATEFAADMSELEELQPTPGLPEVGQASYGKLLLTQQYIDAHQQQHSDFGAAAFMLALYAHPDDTPDEVLDAAHRAILARPITETYADMVFTWLGFLRSTSGTPATPTTTSKPTTTKTTQAFRRFRSGSAPS